MTTEIKQKIKDLYPFSSFTYADLDHHTYCLIFDGMLLTRDFDKCLLRVWRHLSILDCWKWIQAQWHHDARTSADEPERVTEQWDLMNGLPSKADYQKHYMYGHWRIEDLTLWGSHSQLHGVRMECCSRSLSAFNVPFGSLNGAHCALQFSVKWASSDISSDVLDNCIEHLFDEVLAILRSYYQENLERLVDIFVEDNFIKPNRSPEETMRILESLERIKRHSLVHNTTFQYLQTEDRTLKAVFPYVSHYMDASNIIPYYQSLLPDGVFMR